jgi:hypothetical protein
MTRPPAKSSFYNRKSRRQHFMIEIVAVWEPISKVEAAVHWLRVSDLSSILAPLALAGGYANVLALDAMSRLARHTEIMCDACATSSDSLIPRMPSHPRYRCQPLSEVGCRRRGNRPGIRQAKAGSVSSVIPPRYQRRSTFDPFGSSMMRPAACDRDRYVNPQDKNTDALFLKPARKNK